jgi:hypothetical protein
MDGRLGGQMGWLGSPGGAVWLLRSVKGQPDLDPDPDLKHQQ